MGRRALATVDHGRKGAELTSPLDTNTRHVVPCSSGEGGRERREGGRGEGGGGTGEGGRGRGEGGGQPATWRRI